MKVFDIITKAFFPVGMEYKITFDSSSFVKVNKIGSELGERYRVENLTFLNAIYKKKKRKVQIYNVLLCKNATVLLAFFFNVSVDYIMSVSWMYVVEVCSVFK